MYASFKRCKSLKGEKWGLIYLYLLFGGTIDLTPTGRTMIWTFIFLFVNLTLFLKRLWAFVEFSNLFINLCVYDIHSALWLLTEIQLTTSQPPFSEIEVFLERVFDSLHELLTWWELWSLIAGLWMFFVGASCNIASPVNTLFQVIVDFKYKMPLMPCILTLLN